MSQVLQSLMHALHPRAEKTRVSPAKGMVARRGWPPLVNPSGSHRRSTDAEPWFRDGPEDPWRRDQPPAAKPWS